MWNAIVEPCNSFAKTWAWWMGVSILDAAIVLAIVSLVWLVIRRKASPQLGCLLFLLVLAKLFVPLEIAMPERIVAWMPTAALRTVDPLSTSPLFDAVAGEKPVAMKSPVVRRPLPHDVATTPEKSKIPAVPVAVSRSKPSLLAWLMFGWAFCVLTLLARLVHSQRRFHRVVVWTATPLPEGLPGVDFDRLLRQMHITRRLEIVESQKVSSPVVWGMFRPMLILPAGIAASLPTGQLEWVLLHELAHVRRRDLAVKCFQCLATILHFANPAVWLANRAINRLREYACDDMALSLGDGSQVESSEAFLGVMRYAASVQHRSTMNVEGAIGVFESTSRASCFDRMKRLLDTNRRVSARLGLGSICVLLLTAALALPQIRAASPSPSPVKEKTAGQTAGRKYFPTPTDEKSIAVVKKPAEKSGKDAVFQFSVVIARHVMLLDGREIVTWPQIEEIIAKRPNPSQTFPYFYFTSGAYEAGKYESAKKEIWRLDRDYKFTGHSEGSFSACTNWRYDQIKTPADLKPDESLRIDGTVVGTNGKPVAGAEVVLVTPIDDSISYKTRDIAIVDGRIRNPLEHVMVRSDNHGSFALYPPKRKDYYIIALHPAGGIGFLRREQFTRDHKVQLLKWAGLVSMLSEEAENKNK